MLEASITTYNAQKNVVMYRSKHAADALKDNC